MPNNLDDYRFERHGGIGLRWVAGAGFYFEGFSMYQLDAHGPGAGSGMTLQDMDQA